MANYQLLLHESVNGGKIMEDLHNIGSAEIVAIQPSVESATLVSDLHEYWGGVAFSKNELENIAALESGTLPPYWETQYRARYPKIAEPVMSNVIDLRSVPICPEQAEADRIALGLDYETYLSE